jgi:manganese-dependent inorganic pyrophosphatase
MLKRFGMEAPKYVKNMRNQVCDLDFDHPPELHRSVPLALAWQSMRDGKVATIPILNDDGTLYGVLSAGDVASYDLQTVYENTVSDIPLFNLVSVLDGYLVNEFAQTPNLVSGKVQIAVPNSYDDAAALGSESILICGAQPEVIKAALEAKVACLIICQTDIPAELQEDTGFTSIISTPMDARQVVRLIYQAVPVMRLCKTENLVCFHLADYIDDVKETLLNSRFRCYPVLDEEEKVVGTLSRFHLLRPRRKQVVLVDHNEASQSVPGLEQVEILGIIDHHRLADIQTKQPISVRNEPVGSTNTIIASMYQEHGVTPSPAMAGLMAAAILSDTVMFKSPTCTKRDRSMAERMARIARISLDELGQELFSASGAEDKTTEELFMTDYKQFHIAEKDIGVSQITCIDSARMLERKDEFMETMNALRKKDGFDIVILMLTDVLLEGSHILYVGSDEIIQQAFNVQPKDNQVFLPKVMSRKKQIIPMLTALWG